MFASSSLSPVRCSYAPAFPPLPAEDEPSRPASHPLPLYCPTQGHTLTWKRQPGKTYSPAVVVTAWSGEPSPATLIKV